MPTPTRRRLRACVLWAVALLLAQAAIAVEPGNLPHLPAGSVSASEIDTNAAPS